MSPDCIEGELQHLAWLAIAGIRDCTLDRAQDLKISRIKLGRVMLTNGELDVAWNQFAGDREKRLRTRLGRMQHARFAMLDPDFCQIV